eukprot:gnl/TRDRNA2_/TRDRNA2_176043_c24_seq10.p1 gnl/TRDRNA2_/TRDRNA2_176043_c24~~gnl/TRDRNA2_/TRDRNA2_176043_c24_seq10.p1  ORF type:complete len:106 (+),score=25.05 gnl/TRDRNA2_/TRDRNA2_176043_c24_seq10:135-452(+)
MGVCDSAEGRQAVVCGAFEDDTSADTGRAAERCMGMCNTQGLTNTAWSFALTKNFDEKLFGKLARTAERRLRFFNAQEITNMLSAVAIANCCLNNTGEHECSHFL